MQVVRLLFILTTLLFSTHARAADALGAEAPNFDQLGKQVSHLQAMDAFLAATCLNNDGAVVARTDFDCSQALRDHAANIKKVRSQLESPLAELSAGRAEEQNACMIESPLSSTLLKQINPAKTAAAAACAGGGKGTLGNCAKDFALTNAHGLLSLVTESRKVPVAGKPASAPGGVMNPTCITELIRGLWTEIYGTWDLIKSAVTWTGKKIKGWWTQSSAAEDRMSEGLHMATGETQSAFAKFKAHPLEFFAEKTKQIFSAISDGIRDTFACEQWEWGKDKDGLPAQTCVKPLAAWTCATCAQYWNAVCGVAGFAGGIVLEAFLTGGTVRGAKLFAHGASQAHDAVIRAIPGLAKAEATGAKTASTIGSAVSRSAAATGKFLAEPVTKSFQAVEATRVAKAAAQLASDAGSATSKAALKVATSPVGRSVKAVASGASDTASIALSPLKQFSELCEHAYGIGLDGGAAYRAAKAAQAVRATKLAEAETLLGKPLTHTQNTALDKVLQISREADPVVVRRAERMLERAELSHSDIETLQKAGLIPRRTWLTEMPTEVWVRDVELRTVDRSALAELAKSGESARYVVATNGDMYIVRGSFEAPSGKLLIARNTAAGSDASFVVKEAGDLKYTPKGGIQLKPDYGVAISENEARTVGADLKLTSKDTKGVSVQREREIPLAQANIIDCADILRMDQSQRAQLFKQYVSQNSVYVSALLLSEGIHETTGFGTSRIQSKEGADVVIGDLIGSNLGALLYGPTARAIAISGLSVTGQTAAAMPFKLGLVQLQKAIHTKTVAPERKRAADQIAKYNLAHLGVRATFVDPRIQNYFTNTLPLKLYDSCRRGEKISITRGQTFMRLAERGVSQLLYFSGRALLVDE